MELKKNKNKNKKPVEAEVGIDCRRRPTAADTNHLIYPHLLYSLRPEDPRYAPAPLRSGINYIFRTPSTRATACQYLSWRVEILIAE
jgi:hypothetical protein